MKNKSLPLLIGLSLPVLLILMVAGSIYLPRLWIAPPKINFIYSMDTNYYASQEYFVENHKLAVRQKEVAGRPPEFRPPPSEVRLFFHNVTANKSWELTFEQAKDFQLDGSYVSSDGFQVTQGGYGGGGFLFYSYSDSGNVFLKKDNYSKRLNLVNPSSSYYYNNRFHFIGWVTP